MTVFVTGGAGFIGGNYIHYHLAKHPTDRVVCIDKLTYAGNLSTLAPVMEGVSGGRLPPDINVKNPKFRFCRLDICDRDGVFALFGDTSVEDIRSALGKFRERFVEGRSAAFVVRKGALSYRKTVIYKNEYTMRREEVIRHILKYSGEDPVICTTGKASRELFELRETNGQSHEYDFLTVGSMGHCSSIALGVALHKPNLKVWCIDGDGAALMHMGAWAVIGSISPKKLIHIVINNGAHESVGGMPTAAGKVSLTEIARECGYPNAVSVEDFETLDSELEAAKEHNGLHFIEARCAIGARANLGRPTTTARENKEMFMMYIE